MSPQQESVRDMRRDELLQAFSEVDEGMLVIVEPLIEDVVFLEATLDGLRKLPFLRVNPRNPADQKATPAARQYKEFLQQYNNCVKILTGIMRRDGAEEESPLRAYIDKMRATDGMECR